jgi:hypothetical protein
LDSSLRDENEKRKKHKIDDCRRVHDYDEFITTFVSMLAEQNLLGDLLEHGLNIKRSQNRFGSTTLKSENSVEVKFKFSKNYIKVLQSVQLLSLLVKFLRLLRLRNFLKIHCCFNVFLF